jgi:cell division protein FtsB
MDELRRENERLQADIDLFLQDCAQLEDEVDELRRENEYLKAEVDGLRYDLAFELGVRANC